MSGVQTPSACGLHLTPRENQVLGLLAHGLQIKEVATALGCSVKWVKNVRFALGTKFRAHTTLQIVLKAQALGMVHGPGRVGHDRATLRDGV